MLTSSCSQAHRDLLFPYSPVVESFSSVGVSPVVFPLFSHLMSRFTCLDSCFCSLANHHLYLIARDLSSHCEWKFSPLFIDHCCRLRRDFNGIVSCCRLRFASVLLRSCFATFCSCREVVRPCLAAPCFCRGVVRLCFAVFCFRRGVVRLCRPLLLS